MVLEPYNGETTYSQGYQYGSVVIYSCNLGYTLSGPAEITCTETGVWSLTGRTTCTIVGKGNIKVIHVWGSKAEHSCRKYCFLSRKYYVH